MATLDLTTESHYVHHLHRPDFHLQWNPESDDENNRDQYFGNGTSSHHGLKLAAANNVTSDIIVRRQRGRPAGSKNKPKPPVIITRKSSNTFGSHILEVGDGCDVFDCVAKFSRRRQIGICIMSGSGTVTNVRIRQPDAAGSIVTLQGRFEILSLSGSFLPPPAPPGATSLSVFLAGGQGRVVGGNVAGALIAAGPVVIMAISFTNIAYDKLPLENDELLQMEPPVSQLSGENCGGGGDGEGGEINNPFADSSSGLLPFFNLPLNMKNNFQLPVDGWPAGRSSFEE